MPLLFSDDLCAAFTVEVVKSFQEQEPSGYLGRTALQKLVYFSKALGVPVPCSFEIYNYGPYSEDITKAVNRLLGDEAIEDAAPGWARYSSYKPGPSSDDFSAYLSASVAPYRPVIDSVVSVLGKLNPTTLELVATLHFINARLRGFRGSAPRKKDVVQDFKQVKGEKFTEEDISHWFDWLVSVNLT